MTAPNLIQETNIENILETHLMQEISALSERITELQTHITDLDARRAKLVRIAEAAELYSVEAA